MLPSLVGQLSLSQFDFRTGYCAEELRSCLIGCGSMSRMGHLLGSVDGRHLQVV